MLIENGVLTDYTWDSLRARKAGRRQSGNRRRQSYQHLPMVRMTNTILTNGSTDPDDIVADTPNGVYVAHLGGGQVNIATGDFVFGMTEAYLIEDGRITALREGNLTGNGPAVLAAIDASARLRHGRARDLRQGYQGSPWRRPDPAWDTGLQGGTAVERLRSP